MSKMMRGYKPGLYGFVGACLFITMLTLFIVHNTYPKQINRPAAGAMSYIAGLIGYFLFAGYEKQRYADEFRKAGRKDVDFSKLASWENQDISEAFIATALAIWIAVVLTSGPISNLYYSLAGFP